MAKQRTPATTRRVYMYIHTKINTVGRGGGGGGGGREEGGGGRGGREGGEGSGRYFILIIMLSSKLSYDTT